LASLALVCWLSLSERARHEHPLNLILLGCFTLAESVVVGAICAQYTLPSVLLAFAATGVASAAVAAHAATSKRDLTMHGGALLGALVAFLCASILAAVLGLRFMDGLFAAGGAVLFAVYLAVDTQMIFDNSAASPSSSSSSSMMPRRERSFGADEHVAAALAVYLDVVNLLVHLLRLMGERRE
jgi:protein lifeguard